jgi:hypothetical protein
MDALNNEDYPNNNKSNSNQDDNNSEQDDKGGGRLRKAAAIDAATRLAVGLTRSPLIEGLLSSLVACLQ